MAKSDICVEFLPATSVSTSEEDFSSDDDACFMESASVTCLKYFSIMNRYRKEKKYCDLVVVIGNTTAAFSCHRVVLLTASKFFSGLLNSCSKDERELTVDCKAKIAECFENVLEFIYGQRVIVNSTNVHDLLNAGIFFGIDELELYCVKWLERKLPKQRIFETCMFAYAGGKLKLYDKTVKYIAKNIVELSKHDSFYELPDEILMNIVQLQDADGGSGRDLILELINRWKERKIVHKQQAETAGRIVAGDSNEYFDDVVEGHSLHVRISCMENSQNFIQGFTFNDSERRWARNEEYPKNIFCEQNVVLNGKLYTVSTGNIVKNVGEAKSLFRMRGGNGESTTLCPPPLTASKFNSLTRVCDIVYYNMGESTKSSIPSSDMPATIRTSTQVSKSKQLFAYIPSTNRDEWYCVPELPCNATCASISCLDNFLYLISGEPVTSAHFYNHTLRNWIKIPLPSHTYTNGATSSLGEKLYLLNSSNAFEVFIPKAGRWQGLPKPSNQYSRPKLVSYNKKLWAFGCTKDISSKCSYIPVECYDPITNEWTSSESLKIRTGCYDAEVVDAFVIDEKLE